MRHPTHDAGQTATAEGNGAPRQRGQSHLPIQWCRDGYHCTDHPYEGQRCCRCGTADFHLPNPTAGLTPAEVRGRGRL